MKIESIKVKNFKRLVSVEIKPGSNLVKVKSTPESRNA